MVSMSMARTTPAATAVTAAMTEGEAPAGHDVVRHHIGRSTREESEERGDDAARAIGLIHEVEGKREDWVRLPFQYFRNIPVIR